MLGVNEKFGDYKIGEGLSSGTRSQTQSPSPEKKMGLLRSHTISPSLKKKMSLLRVQARATAGLEKSGYEMRNIFLKRQNTTKHNPVVGAGVNLHRSSFRVSNNSIGGEIGNGWEAPYPKKIIEKNLFTTQLTVQSQAKDSESQEKKSCIQPKKGWKIEDGVMKEILLDEQRLPELRGRRRKASDLGWDFNRSFAFDTSKDFKFPSKGPAKATLSTLLAESTKSVGSKKPIRNPFQSSVFKSMKGLQNIMFDGRRENLPIDAYLKKVDRDGYVSNPNPNSDSKSDGVGTGGQVMNMLGPLMLGAHADEGGKLVSLL